MTEAERARRRRMRPKYEAARKLRHKEAAARATAEILATPVPYDPLGARRREALARALKEGRA